MTASRRKLLATILLLGFVLVYAIVAMAVAIVLQVNASKTMELVYYVVAGLAWVPFAAWLIKWMHASTEQ